MLEVKQIQSCGQSQEQAFSAKIVDNIEQTDDFITTGQNSSRSSKLNGIAQNKPNREKFKCPYNWNRNTRPKADMLNLKFQKGLVKRRKTSIILVQENNYVVNSDVKIDRVQTSSVNIKSRNDKKEKNKMRISALTPNKNSTENSLSRLDVVSEQPIDSNQQQRYDQKQYFSAERRFEIEKSQPTRERRSKLQQYYFGKKKDQ